MQGDRTAADTSMKGQESATKASNSIVKSPHERLDSYGSHASLEQSPQQVLDSPHRTEEHDDLAISIRFGEEADLSLQVARIDTVAEVKDKIKAARPALENKYLRLIHSGKVLEDEKTMFESLPKSLFTHFEIPVEPSARSRISSSLEAAVSHILTSHPHQQNHQDRSRTSHDSIRGTSIGSVSASLGAMLPTHIMRSETSSLFSSEDEAHASIPSSAKGKGKAVDHITIDIPPENSESTLAATTSTKASVPLQTGPIYILCSVSDLPPNKKPPSSTKGKAVVRNHPSPADRVSSTASTRAGRVRRGRDLAARSPISGESAPSPSPANAHQQRGEQHASEDSENENQENATALSPAIGPPATGFDRLREAGFSEEEIRLIRRDFHASRDTMDAFGGETEQNEEAEARARRIEDEWIDRHGSETLPEGLEGSYGEMVWGLILGFFMGLISLFWLKEATFTRRQQMGVVGGMTLNVMFGLLRFL
ncbi:hypothetical protein BGZ73_009133 [Actinomortierella ambigua]|nr:hypothetical protein BGZ73_009133 [Actinomortierella ambigua]